MTLKILATYQSVVTMLDARLRQRAACVDIRLHVASSFEDPAETRRCVGEFHEAYIPRSIGPNSAKKCDAFWIKSCGLKYFIAKMKEYGVVILSAL